MKKLLIAALLFTALSAKSKNEKNVLSTVKNVTVFTQGAQVFRSAPVNLSPGISTLVFNGLSSYINPASIQAGGKGNFIILEVKHEIKYPEPPKVAEGELPKEVQKEIKFIEDSLRELNFSTEESNEKKNELQMEKNMILKNKLTLGEGKSDSLPMLKDAMEFFRIKLNDINAQLMKIKRNEQRISDETKRLSARLNDLREYDSNEVTTKKYEPIHQVIVTVSAEEAVTGSVELNYTVSNAGWTPSYDLRSSGTAAPVQLTYKANVFQNTGEEWNDVKLKLSTSNPNRSNIKPQLPVWYLNYYMPRPTAVTGGTMSMRDKNREDDFKEAEQKMEELSPAQSAANYSEMVETMTNVQFDITLAYSIPSDGITHMVSVKSEELTSDYYHFLVPKIDNEAFLLAKVTGWEALNLLPGKANIFYEGTYVGETMINPSVITDTLELAMGRDHGLTITRTRLPEKEKNKLFGNDITKTITYELKMKNNKSKPVNLVIEDQIPVATNNGIKIELKDNGKADYNDKTGLLKWTTAMNSKENKSYTFSYSVTYNKDLQLSIY